jgi:hypothetical protein
MSKEEKAKEYADYAHKHVEEFYGRKCAEHDFYYKKADVRLAYESGWDEALKSQWIKVETRMPKVEEYVLVMIEYEGSIQIHLTMYLGETNWLFADVKIIAWMPIPSFDKTLEDNKRRLT